MKKLSAIILSALMLFGLTSCAGGAASSAPAQSTPASAQTGVAVDPAVQQPKSIEDIKAAGKLVMMTNATFPPFEYITGDGPAGVDIALAQMVADEIGVELEVLDMNFDLLIAALQSGKGDLVAAGMSITDERKVQVDFSTLYVDTAIHILVPIGSEIKTADDLAGLSIAVQESTTSDLFVTDNVENANVMRFKNAVDAGGTVINGKADVAVIDFLTGSNIVSKNTEKLVLLEEPIGNDKYAMAVAKGNAELLAVVNKVLEQAVADGTVDKLLVEHMENSK